MWVLGNHAVWLTLTGCDCPVSPASMCFIINGDPIQVVRPHVGVANAVYLLALPCVGSWGGTAPSKLLASMGSWFPSAYCLLSTFLDPALLSPLLP